jgi:sulfur transfer complex TusBCD TusB component (DsrH family)
MGHPFVAALEADRARGLDTVVVLIQDAVLFDAHLAGPAVRERHTWRWLADDLRRRGLPVGNDAVDYDGLVDLMAAAKRVVSW